jgi:rhamnosyl/mannosyltransferase
MRSQTRAKSNALGIGSRVRFHGTVSDDEKDALILACDCLCLPSTDRTESFGIVLLEAMSAGKACVVSEIPGSGVNWVVDSGQTGVMVEGDNPAALANALERLSDDRAQLSSMGARGRERFEQLLTIEASAQAVIKLYEEIAVTNTETPS